MRFLAAIAIWLGLALPALAQPVSPPPGTVALVCAYNSSIPLPVTGQFFYVQCDSSGNLITNSTGGGTPGGTTGQLQYNNSGAFGGYSVALVSKSSGTL